MPVQEDVRQIAISETTIVAMTVSGKCCAWDLSTGIGNMGGQSPECIETPVMEVQIMSVFRGTIAILHHGSEEMMDVTAWDINGCQSHCFRIEINQGAIFGTCSYFVIINSDEQSIVFFERVFDFESGYVLYTRTNLKGQIESSGRMEHPDLEGYSMHSKGIKPVCTTGHVTLWSYFRSRPLLDARKTKNNTWEIIRVVYDTKANRLELQRHTVVDSIQTQLARKDFFWWKDVAYCENEANGSGVL